MKRIISLSLILLLSIIFCFGSAFQAFAATFLPGDADGNGRVTAADARIVLRVSAKLDPPLSGNNKLAADFDKDGIITAVDARAILRIAAGLDFPYGEINTNPTAVANTLNQFNELANRVKTDKQGFFGTETSRTDSISIDYNKLSLIGAVFATMGLEDELRAEEGVEQVSNFNIYPDTENTKTYYPVAGKEWSSQLDTAGVRGIVSHNEQSDPIKHMTIYMNRETLNTLPQDAATTHHGKVFTTPSASDMEAIFDGAEDFITVDRISITYSNSYIEYVYDSDADVLVSAKYYLHSSVTLHTTIAFTGFGSTEFKFTLETTTVQEFNFTKNVTINYDDSKIEPVLPEGITQQQVDNFLKYHLYGSDLVFEVKLKDDLSSTHVINVQVDPSTTVQRFESEGISQIIIKNIFNDTTITLEAIQAAGGSD